MKRIILAGIALVAVFGLGQYFASVNQANASAPSGLQATIATSSFQGVVINTAELVFATSSCSSRTITTGDTNVRLVFSDVLGQRPTGTNGHLQVASTTVTYDSGLYGCDAVWVYPYGTATLTLTEAR